MLGLYGMCGICMVYGLYDVLEFKSHEILLLLNTVDMDQWKTVELCRVEEHQHQLAHQCSPNIIEIWEWGICGLMGGAFIT